MFPSGRPPVSRGIIRFSSQDHATRTHTNVAESIVVFLHIFFISFFSRCLKGDRASSVSNIATNKESLLSHVATLLCPYSFVPQVLWIYSDYERSAGSFSNYSNPISSHPLTRNHCDNPGTLNLRRLCLRAFLNAFQKRLASSILLSLKTNNNCCFFRLPLNPWFFASCKENGKPFGPFPLLRVGQLFWSYELLPDTSS